MNGRKTSFQCNTQVQVYLTFECERHFFACKFAIPTICCGECDVKMNFFSVRQIHLIVKMRKIKINQMDAKLLFVRAAAINHFLNASKVKWKLHKFKSICDYYHYQMSIIQTLNVLYQTRLISLVEKTLPASTLIRDCTLFHNQIARTKPMNGNDFCIERARTWKWSGFFQLIYIPSL